MEIITTIYTLKEIIKMQKGKKSFELIKIIGRKTTNGYTIFLFDNENFNKYGGKK